MIGLKLAVISDPHLGTKWGSPREQDSFDQFREAIERAMGYGAQLILILGDIFDTRIPRQEIWAQALRILSLPLAHGRNSVRLVRTIDKDTKEISPVALRGIPVVALHGNHERRTKGLTNPVEALEAAGLVIHLHHNSLVFEGGGRLIAIHGMSNVPEQYASKVLKMWNPKPVEGAFNVLALHQSIGQYVYSGEETPTLDVSDLPPGFDLYLCGHIHYRNEASAHGRPLIFPGSTERTQLIKVEAEVPKGFYMLEIGEGLRLEFIELKKQRDFYYEEMRFDGATIFEIDNAVRVKLNEILQRPRKNPNKLPMIRLRLMGTLAKEASRSEFDDRLISEDFADRAIVVIGKADLQAPEIGEKVQMLRELREQRLSMDETAMRLLEDSLRDAAQVSMFDVRSLYNLLVADRVDEALQNVYRVVESLVKADVKEKKDDNVCQT
ncbi:MAG: DNA repair exonuclease [Candidatus Hadarchaeum sp.]|uniref:metallophosphoesterase family protein n=1 Tax=Candidatus Hadarchaeum sp. TaxID=2883567 RepID=UPI00317CE04A